MTSDTKQPQSKLDVKEKKKSYAINAGQGLHRVTRIKDVELSSPLLRNISSD
jgi:hypothetical protein